MFRVCRRENNTLPKQALFDKRTSNKTCRNVEDILGVDSAGAEESDGQKECPWYASRPEMMMMTLQNWDGTQNLSEK